MLGWGNSDVTVQYEIVTEGVKALPKKNKIGRAITDPAFIFVYKIFLVVYPISK